MKKKTRSITTDAVSFEALASGAEYLEISFPPETMLQLLSSPRGQVMGEGIFVACTFPASGRFDGCWNVAEEGTVLCLAKHGALDALRTTAGVQVGDRLDSRLGLGRDNRHPELHVRLWLSVDSPWRVIRLGNERLLNVASAMKVLRRQEREDRSERLEVAVCTPRLRGAHNG